MTKIDETKPAAVIAAKFGNISDFAKAIDRPYITAYQWVRRGLIPTQEQSHVLSVAKELDIGVTANDFIIQE